jgi:DNA-binding beta-propeller fold protein YncE
MDDSVLGTDSYTYTVKKSWGTLPEGVGFADLSAVAVDSQDRVYVYQRGDPPIFVFDSSGDYVRSLGSGVIRDPHGMFVSSDDHLFLVDRDGHEVLKMTIDGDVVLRLGHRDRASFQSPFNHPAGVAVAPDGDIYVADGYGNARVHHFSPQGDLIASWGQAGSGPGEFKVPHSISLDSSQRIYVGDRDNHRIQIFDADGVFLSEWTDFFRPTAIHIDRNDVVYVIDHSLRLTILDTAGSVLTRGRTGNVGHGIWSDSRGNLYVSLEVHERRVEQYVKAAN